MLLVPTSGATRIIALPPPFAATSDPSVLALDQVDLAAGTVTPRAPPAAVEYMWYAAQLIPHTGLNGPTGPAPAIIAKPIGNPDGDNDFTIWQSGTVSRVCVQRPGALVTRPSSCCVPPKYVVASLGATAAWSPDLRYLAAPPGRPAWREGAHRDAAGGQPPGCLHNPQSHWRRLGLAGARPGAGKRLASPPGIATGTAFPAMLTVYDRITGAPVVQAPLPSLEPGIEQTGQAGMLSPPIWSPDGSRLLILDDSTQALAILGAKSLRG